MGRCRAILGVMLVAGVLGACTAAKPRRPMQPPAIAAELRAGDVYTPGPRTRVVRTLVTTGSGDRRVDEERIASPPDAQGTWAASTRERVLESDTWVGVQTLELSFAADGSVVLHAIANEESGKRVRFRRRSRDAETGSQGLVMMPAVLRRGDVHEDVCAARTTSIDGASSDALTGTARVRTWIAMEPSSNAGDDGLVLHVDLTISAGPAIVQRRTHVRFAGRDGRWVFAGERAMLRVLVGPLTIDETTRDAEAVREPQAATP